MATMYLSSKCEYNNWIKTDDDQWVYRNECNQFWVIQIRLWGDENEYGITLNLIDLDTYDDEDIFEVMEEYGISKEEVLEIDAQYIAENLAENIDDFHVEFKGTFEECEDWVEKYINTHGGSSFKI